jgi:hypothetical protein
MVVGPVVLTIGPGTWPGTIAKETPEAKEAKRKAVNPIAKNVFLIIFSNKNFYRPFFPYVFIL